MITMVYDREQLGAAAANLERLSKVMSDLTETMDVIGAYLVSSTQRRFQTQTGPDGAPWVQSLRSKIQSGAAAAPPGAPPAATAAPAAGPTPAGGKTTLLETGHAPAGPHHTPGRAQHG